MYDVPHQYGRAVQRDEPEEEEYVPTAGMEIIRDPVTGLYLAPCWATLLYGQPRVNFKLTGLRDV